MSIESMMVVGDRLWQRFGVSLDHPATSAEAIVKSGLDWSVRREPVFDARGKEIPRLRAVVRTDRLETLGVVGHRYAELQNGEAFAFMDHLVGDGKAVYETAGALDRGRQVWLLARIPGDVWVTSEDPVGKYLLLTNSHDGQSPLRALFTPIRVWCKNTLRAALAQGKASGVSIRHVGNILEKAEEAKRLLGISEKYFDSFGEEAQAFAGRDLLRQEAARYFEELIPSPKEGDPTRAQVTRETLLRLFEAGKGNDLPSVRGTLWAALNAVTEFVDHERPTRAKEGESEHLKRFQSAQFGSGAVLRARAWEMAQSMVR